MAAGKTKKSQAQGADVGPDLVISRIIDAPSEGARKDGLSPRLGPAR